jgi:hypothetical protein
MSWKIGEDRNYALLTNFGIITGQRGEGYQYELSKTRRL